MIPLKLTIKGLYSYRDSTEHTIDFTTLTQAGLFGIFGPVGSGKSTIPEAIAFALYEDSGRLNVRGDDRYYNMMNLKSSELLVRFDFKVSSSDDIEYRSEVSSTRQKKNFDKVGASKRRLFQRIGAEWVPIEKPVEEILGLSYQNFRRTVIIPQGKFQEFLQLSGTERTQMMKELFQLAKFDLHDRAKRIRSSTAHRRSELEGRLLELGDIDDQQLRDLEKVLKELSEKRDAIANQLSKKQEDDRAQERLREITLRKEKLTGQLKGLEAQASDFVAREAQLKKFTACHNLYKPLLDQQEKLLQQQEDALSLQTRRRERISLIDRTLSELKGELEACQTLDAGQVRKEISELHRLADLKETISQRDAKQTELTAMQERLTNYQNQLDSLAEEIKDAQEEKQRLQERVRIRKELPPLREWFAEKTQLESTIVELRERLQELNAQLDVVQSSRQKRLEPLAKSKWLTPLELALPPVDLEKLLSGNSESAEKQIDEAIELLREADRERAKREVGLQEKEQAKSIAKLVREREKALTESRALLRQLVEIRIDLGELIGEEKSLLKRHEELQAEVKGREASLLAHREEFAWEDFSPDDDSAPEKLSTRIEQIEEEYSAAEKRLEDLQNQERSGRQEFSEYQGTVNELTNAHTMLGTRVETTLQSLETIVLEDLQAQTSLDLQNLASEKEKAFNRMSQRLLELETSLKRHSEERARISGELDAGSGQLTNLENEQKVLSEQLAIAITDSGYGSVEEVQSILAVPLDVEQEHEAINSYQQQVKLIGEQLQAVEAEQGGEIYSFESHQRLQSEIRELTDTFEEHSRSLGSQESVHKRLKADLAARREVSEELAGVDKRLANLQTMLSLFRGAGFVNYVSTIYLRNLVSVANERFTRLTRRQLELELAEDNSFLVRDYLNGGALRSIKTLSGGQTFQAALCLALALSDSIQTPSGQSHQFFFLDEGFGTLDRDSLQVVLTTLKALRKEARIVGVISHVEELQQEIDVHLRITNDPELGSSVCVP